jgi:hypothetical protein
MKQITAEWVTKAEDDFAVTFRYPGESADKESAIEAKKFCSFFRKIARSSLGLQ